MRVQYNIIRIYIKDLLGQIHTEKSPHKAIIWLSFLVNSRDEHGRKSLPSEFIQVFEVRLRVE